MIKYLQLSNYEIKTWNTKHTLLFTIDEDEVELDEENFH